MFLVWSGLQRIAKGGELLLRIFAMYGLVILNSSRSCRSCGAADRSTKHLIIRPPKDLCETNTRHNSIEGLQIVGWIITITIPTTGINATTTPSACSHSNSNSYSLCMFLPPLKMAFLSLIH